MKEFWNERYAVQEYVYGKEPNGFFREIIDGLKPGKILLPAEGEGRNAVYAAKEGWEVVAFDISEIAMKKALDLAKENNVKISYFLSSMDEFQLDHNYYDAIGLIYAHQIPMIREGFHNSLFECVKNSGVIFLEAFNKKQIERNSGGPKSLDMLYDMNTLSNDFSSFDIKLLEESVQELNESSFHYGKADIIRLIAKKN